jgi:RHS repeat-associated protein
MNPFRTSKKTQEFKGQNPYLTEPTSGVCLQNTYDYSPFGVSLDGRTVEGDFYRRGFNGMEKDDDLKGDGNSYTTEFRQLDPRVGRWLSVDPIMKPHLSPYNSMSNNPIIRIDPNGDDDYFNSDGSYNRKMSKKYNNNGSHNIYVLGADGVSKKELHQMPLVTLNDRKVVANIINMYAKKVGVSGWVGLNKVQKEDGREPYASTGSNSKKVNVNSLGGHIHDDLFNYHNLQSVLFHEKTHQEDLNDKMKVVNDISFEGLLNHSTVYLRQIQDKTFESTTEDFKFGAIRNYAIYLQKTYDKISDSFDEPGDLRKIERMINNFNENEGKKYGYNISTREAGTTNIKIKAKRIN